MAAAAQPEVQSVDPTLVYNLPLSEYYLVLDVRSREDWLRGTQRFVPTPPCSCKVTGYGAVCVAQLLDLCGRSHCHIMEPATATLKSRDRRGRCRETCWPDGCGS